MSDDTMVQWVPFESLLAEPVRNGIYKEKQFHGYGAKIVNMGELYSYPRLQASVSMKRVQLTEKELDKALLLDGDLIFARRSLTAEGAGKCSVVLSVETPTTFESSIIRARLDETKANPLFYYYFFNSPIGKYQLGTILRQVAVAGITGSDLAKLQVPIIPKDKQDYIASLLGEIDDKIDLNRQINQTLEQIAQAIFQSWFVDFAPVKAKIAARAEGRDPRRAAMCALSGKTDAELEELPGDQFDQLAATAALFPEALVESELGEIPEGWGIGTLGSQVEQIATSVSVEELADDEPYFGLEHLPRRSIALDSWGYAEGLESGKRRFSEGTILFGKLRPYFHKVGVAPVAGVCSTDILALQAKTPEWFGYALAHLSSDALIAFAARLSNGAKMPRVNWKDLEKYPVVLPCEQIAAIFTKVVDALVSKIKENIFQSQALAELRDSLLPKLLSGELSVRGEEPTPARQASPPLPEREGLRQMCDGALVEA